MAILWKANCSKFYAFQILGQGLSAEAQVAQYRQAQASLPALIKEVEALEEERSEFVAALPKSTEMANILSEMRRTAEETGILVNSIGVSGGSAQALPGGVRPIGLNVAMNGTYSEAFKSLQRLETLNRFSTVDGLSLQMTEPTSLDPELNGTMGITVYTFDPAMASTASAEDNGNAPAAPPPPAQGGE